LIAEADSAMYQVKAKRQVSYETCRSCCRSTVVSSNTRRDRARGLSI
jgi:hypothetical protein